MSADRPPQTAPGPAGSAGRTAEPPLQLWRVLEDEFRTLYGEALDLDEEYEKTRDAAIRQANDEIENAVRESWKHLGRHFSDAELADEVVRKIASNPSLVNVPACRALFQKVHQFVERDPANLTKHSALCLSGGGIRSATFALGVLQGLAGVNALEDFSYLSTVSGGGFVGAWLSSWIERSPGKLPEVAAMLAASGKPAPTDPHHPGRRAAARDLRQPFDTEPEAIWHLRRYSNYLTPALGLGSGDSWTLVAIVVRNLLLNWMLIVPFLLLLLLGPRIAFCLGFRAMEGGQAAGFIFGGLAFASGVYALANLIARRGVTQLQVFLNCVVPILIFCSLATLAWCCAIVQPATQLIRWQSPALFLGWGMLTPILALPIAAWLRRRGTVPAATPNGSQPAADVSRPGGIVIRLASMCLIFGLTGLALWRVGEAIAIPMKQAVKAPHASQAGARTPSPAVTSAAAPAPSSAPQKDVKKSLEYIVDDDPSRQGQASNPKLPLYGIALSFPLILALIFLANTILTGLLSRYMVDGDREWLARTSGWAFFLALLSCALNLIVLVGPEWLVAIWQAFPALLPSMAGGSAVLTILGGRVAATGLVARQVAKSGSTISWLLPLLLRGAAYIFVILLLAGFSLLTTLVLQAVTYHPIDPTKHVEFLEGSNFLTLFGAAVFLGLITLVSTLCVNINKFSLHAMYRNRLIRAYLGATNGRRAPNRFTGFDESDNLPMADLRSQRPFHVVNAALNLVGSPDLAWQQRLATSFTFTPLASGSATVGYRDSLRYAQENHPRTTGITLGTALAISGGAVSPNHGYNSSPFLAFLLTFFNARLGGWFGNPGWAGAETWQRSSPRHALQPIIAEALGRTDATHPYVYLSDGGHFENLGLYEMVLRRCRVIVVSDAGCDPDYWFENLGNAASKIRVDLGIPIVFDPHMDIRRFYPDDDLPMGLADGSRFYLPIEKRSGIHCAVGRILYSKVDGPAPKGQDRDGYLIYIKPALCGNEPMDVYHYFRKHPQFPHESTTDQWFTELQFESYRMLGYHSIQEICSRGPVTDLAGLVRQAGAYVRARPPVAAPAPAPVQPVQPVQPAPVAKKTRRRARRE